MGFDDPIQSIKKLQKAFQSNTCAALFRVLRESPDFELTFYAILTAFAGKSFHVPDRFPNFLLEFAATSTNLEFAKVTALVGALQDATVDDKVPAMATSAINALLKPFLSTQKDLLLSVQPARHLRSKRVLERLFQLSTDWARVRPFVESDTFCRYVDAGTLSTTAEIEQFIAPDVFLKGCSSRRALPEIRTSFQAFEAQCHANHEPTEEIQKVFRHAICKTMYTTDDLSSLRFLEDYLLKFPDLRQNPKNAEAFANAAIIAGNSIAFQLIFQSCDPALYPTLVASLKDVSRLQSFDRLGLHASASRGTRLSTEDLEQYVFDARLDILRQVFGPEKELLEFSSELRARRRLSPALSAFLQTAEEQNEVAQKLLRLGFSPEDLPELKRNVVVQQALDKSLVRSRDDVRQLLSAAAKSAKASSRRL